MKYKLIIALVVLLSSCSYNFEYEQEVSFLDTPAEIMEWVCYNIKYERDPKEYWQSPNETMARRIGDCEDYTILMMYLLKENLGKYSSFVIVSCYRDGDYIGPHALLKSNRIYYDPTNNYKTDNLSNYEDRYTGLVLEEVITLPYEVAMPIATGLNTKGIEYLNTVDGNKKE